MLHATAFAPALSHDRLTLGDGGATATNSEDLYCAPAALVAVGRGGGAEGFVLAAVFEALPFDYTGGYVSFGVGRAMPKQGAEFGLVGKGAGTMPKHGACGLRQETSPPHNRWVGAESFGRRADRDDDWFPGPTIVQGSRVALHLSPRGAEGRRTARFFVDKEEVAVFVDIEDDGGGSDWVAGVTLSKRNVSVRLVPAEGVELIAATKESIARARVAAAAADWAILPNLEKLKRFYETHAPEKTSAQVQAPSPLPPGLPKAQAQASAASQIEKLLAKQKDWDAFCGKLREKYGVDPESMGDPAFLVRSLPPSQPPSSWSARPPLQLRPHG